MFDEYRYSLQQAYYMSEKRSVGPASSTLHPAAGAVVAVEDGDKMELNAHPGNKTTTSATAAVIVSSAANVDKAPAAVAAARRKDSRVVSEPEGVVEIIAQNEGMKVAFKRLNDILTPYLKEDNVDVSAVVKVSHRPGRHLFVVF